MNDNQNPENNPAAGFRYFFAGLKLITKPGIRSYVIIPLMINLLLFTFATALAIYYLSGWVSYAMNYIPEWLAFIEAIIWLFIAIVILLVTYFTFSIIANFIASPFNGLLAEQVEWIKTGEKMPDSSMKQLIASVPSSLAREVVKMAWYLPWLIALSILTIIPVVNTISGILWFLFTSWAMAIQYADYACENHQGSFSELRQELKRARFTSLGFGSVVSVLTLIPILNLVVMPAAVCGGTLLYLDNLQDNA